MYRLRFRKSWIGLLALVGGLIVMSMMRLNPFSTGTNFDLPILWIVPAQIILPLLFAFYQYRSCPTIQQIAAYFWLISMICLMGTLGNLFADPMAIIQQDWLVHFNAVQLGVMNLLSMMACINLLHAEQISSFADAKVAEAQLGRLKAVKVDPETQVKWEKAASHAQAQADGRSLRSTMTNLKAISLQDPSQQLTSPAQMPKEMPKRPAEPAAEAGSLASLLDRIGDEPAAIAGEDLEENQFKPSAEPVKAKVEAKPELKPEPVEPQFAPLESSPELGLDAILENAPATFESFESFTPEPAAFEPEPFTAPEPVKEPSGGGMMGAFKSTSQASTPATPSEPVATATSQASPQAQAQAASEATVTPVTPADIPQSPTSSSTRLQAMKRRNTSTFTKLQSLSSSSALKPQALDSTPTAEPDSLKNLLDRLDDDHVQEPAQPLTPPVEIVLDTVFKEDGHLEVQATAPVATTTAATTAVPSPAVQAALEKARAMAEAEAAQEAQEREPAGHSSISERLTPAAPAETFEPSLANMLDMADAAEPEVEVEESAVDKSINNVFASAPASQSIAEFVTETNDADFPKTVEVDLSPLLSEPLESAQEQAVEVAPVEIIKEEEPAEDEESGSLFDASLDTDIDNIFSELAPPEAHKDVTQRVSEGSADSEDDDSEGSLFNASLDSDIDNIFSELAPPEALMEVKDVLKPSVEAEKIAEPETEESDDQEEGLFGETLGEDLDNIFSGLTDDKQLEVSPETLAKVKQAAPEGEDKVASPRATGDMPAITPEKAEAIKAEAEAQTKAAEEAKALAESKAEEEKKASEAAEKPAATTDKSSPNYKEVKEFGRLSTKSGSLKSAPEAVGTMKTIGKLLLDVKAVENIIKSGETKKLGSGLSTAKVISAARGEGIRNILVAIDTYEGVAGSLIVGHDGLVIASTVGTGWDKDMLGALSTALLSTSNLATKKLEIGKLKQMVLLTKLTDESGDKMKTTVLTDVEVGILAVFLEATDLTKIDGLIETIHTTIHGS